ncbi:MAG TPA: RluA family pseudouridine synthase [Blastocatellia bacterium]|nr:RluA family pseudouridine synthase [Blastocatellia bacterium]
MAAEELTITVAPEYAGFRLDACLAAQLADVSRATIQKAIQSGDCLVNERRTKASYKVRAGDEIQLELPDAAPLEAAPENIPLDIVYEDDDLIVINKPAGMVVHPGAGVSSGTLANALVYHFNQLSQANSLRPGIVHRLDVGTSGLMVVAKTDRAHQHLAAQFEARTVEKHYTALVYGAVKADEGRIDAPIGRDPRSRVKMSARPVEQGRHALTLYRVVERFTDFTLLDVEIKTGRTHQIRVHLAHLKHPIVGDTTYDGGRVNTVKDARLRSAIEKLGRPVLHAASLCFTHLNGEQMKFGTPLPDGLQAFLANLRGAA